jgi:hypothetical protein
VVLKLPEFVVPEGTVFGQVPPPPDELDELLLDEELELLEEELLLEELELLELDELEELLEDELLLEEEPLEPPTTP